MAFKNTPPPPIVPGSPEQILLELPRRKIPGVLLHQGEAMRSYATKAINAKDVALQLPTGSGKTLVGLMIAEWRRRKFHERVLYLCATNQLVNQVVEQSERYGLTVHGFTGRHENYAPIARSEYQNADRIAVTNYSSLFNVKPFFVDPDVIILDDAHASENYIAAHWTLRVDRGDAEHKSLHAALVGVLKPWVGANFTRLSGKCESVADNAWVDKIPTPIWGEIHDELRTVMEEHVDKIKGKNPPRFAWAILRDHLHACHLYMSAREIMIRPLIPPTWTHAPFANARQRIFMSATLGAGGDLERLTGRPDIMRIPVPDGWDRQGIGRRYFIFPGMAMKDEEAGNLRRDLMRRAGRSLVLVPSDKARVELADDVEAKLGFKVFAATDIEDSKKSFVATDNAVAVVANRYDGIDFPGDDCRLLFIEGLPKATNLQERFLMARMGAAILLNDRVQTRVLQAIGRCTRSLEDYSAVVVSGDELPDYLADRRRRSFLHPELQAELEFGIEQSQGTSVADLLDNFGIFLENAERWEAANQEILSKRQAATQQPFPAMKELQSAVSQEIEYQRRLWQEDYEVALDYAERVLGGLTSTELRGYRALWHYLAGSAAWLGAQQGVARLAAKAREHFRGAKESAPAVPWLVGLSRHQSEEEMPSNNDTALLRQVERVEAILAKLGTVHDRTFARREREILDGLANEGGFEQAQVKLGELLGFDAGKIETDASPDPWWIADNLCLVFEDHAGAESDSVLDATKARQASTHPNWMREHVEAVADGDILSVLVTPVTKAKEGAIPHLRSVALWPLAEFREWATRALLTIRELRRTFPEPGDLAWRAEAIAAFKLHELDARALFTRLKSQLAGDVLKSVK